MSNIKVIQCGNLIDGTGAPGVEDAVIVIKGSIEPGKLADIAILSSDITGPEFQLNTAEPTAVEQAKKEQKKTKVHMTILNGEIVYQV